MTVENKSGYGVRPVETEAMRLVPEQTTVPRYCSQICTDYGNIYMIFIPGMLSEMK